jgi:hypothetical protein
MFILSQYILEKFNLCSKDNVSTYAIAVGLLVYATIYLYLLFSSGDLVVLFNKFLVYIIGVDLLLSAFYTFNGNYEQMAESPVISPYDTDNTDDDDAQSYTESDIDETNDETYSDIEEEQEQDAEVKQEEQLSTIVEELFQPQEPQQELPQEQTPQELPQEQIPQELPQEQTPQELPIIQEQTPQEFLQVPVSQESEEQRRQLLNDISTITKRKRGRPPLNLKF